MAYDNTSFYGDLIVDEYDDKNNFVGTITPAGFYIYHILGDSFDLMSEQCSDWMNNFSILTASAKGLDNFWGVSYGMPRPSIHIGTANERKLTDEEYRIYLYLRNCRLMTREDIEVNMNKCFQIDDYQIHFSEETNYLTTVDHLDYESATSLKSNLMKNNNDDGLNFVTDFESDDETLLFESGLSNVSETVNVVNIPFNNYDSAFLSLIEKYISVKGDLQIREYSL